MINEKCQCKPNSPGHLLCLVVIGLLLMATNTTGTEVTFRGPFGIAVRPDGSFYVAEIDGRRITKFDPDGNRIGQINQIQGYGQLKGPFDVEFDDGDNLYIADEPGHSILVLDKDEQLILKLGTGQATEEPGGFYHPHFLAVNEKLQLIYVADTINNRVQIFDSQGKLLKILGRLGRKEPGTYHHPTGIDCDEKGNLYVMSMYGRFINVYNPQWQLVGTLGRKGTGGGQFESAYALLYHQNTIWVADTYNNRVQQISLDGKSLKIFGGVEGDSADQFSHPTDLGFDAQGNIYVADWKNNRVMKLDPTGRFLRQWGTSATAMDYTPAKIYQRNPCRGPITIGTYSGISRSGIDNAAAAGVDWVYPSLGFDDEAQGQWNIKADVDYAHQKGVKVAPSVAIFYMGRDSSYWRQRTEFYMWKKGGTAPSKEALSYFFPEVRSWKAKHLAEQIRKNRLDGILLDYIRYPGNIMGYEPAMVEAFKKETGKDPAKIPSDDWDWLKFRSRHIALFITELRYELAQLDWPVEVSVYVGPDWKKDLQGSMRDWRDWVRMGIIDKLCLGMYSRDFQSFYQGVLQARETCPARIKINIMIACWGGNLSTPELLKKGFEVSFAADADEVSIYRGDAINRLGLWQTIGEISAQYKN